MKLTIIYEDKRREDADAARVNKVMASREPRRYEVRNQKNEVVFKKTYRG